MKTNREKCDRTNDETARLGAELLRLANSMLKEGFDSGSHIDIPARAAVCSVVGLMMSAGFDKEEIEQYFSRIVPFVLGLEMRAFELLPDGVRPMGVQ